MFSPGAQAFWSPSFNTGTFLSPDKDGHAHGLPQFSPGFSFDMMQTPDYLRTPKDLQRDLEKENTKEKSSVCVRSLLLAIGHGLMRRHAHIPSL